MKDRLVFNAAALDSIELIESYTAGYDLSEFLEYKKTQDAVVRNLEIIGQALKDFVTETLLKEMPDMPWREIVAMRNILAHEYLGVDAVMVWDTVQNYLDVLKKALQHLNA